MIEFCTKRRMILAIAGLIIISVVVLFVEHRMSPSSELHEVSTLPVTGNLTYKCWEVAETVTIVEECRACTGFEKKIITACKETGYTEKVSCKLKDETEGELFRSCPKITRIEEKNFWCFEAIVACLGLGSYSVVHLRQKRLERLLVEKVNKQIASGV